MRNSALRRTLLVSFAAVLGLAGRASPGAEEIVLGNIASTSVPTARDNSNNLLLGYNVHFEHVNRQGGVRGRKIKLVNKDDGVQAENMVALTKELIADKNVVALVGFLNTAGITELIKQEIPLKNNIAMIAHIGAQSPPNFYPVRAGYNQEVDKILGEMRDTQKKRIGLVYLNLAFGPSTFKYASESAKKMGLNVVATGSFETADKMDAGIEAVVSRFAKENLDAVFIMAGGIGAYKFVKRLREVSPDYLQVYALSPADYFGFVKVAGLKNAQGVIISQCIPPPQNSSLAIVREYQKAMKQYAPKAELSFFGLEGFMGAKVAVEALRRAGPNPTREKVVAALNTMKDFDLGDFVVSYSPTERSGSKLVDLTIIGSNGALYR